MDVDDTSIGYGESYLNVFLERSLNMKSLTDEVSDRFSEERVDLVDKYENLVMRFLSDKYEQLILFYCTKN